MPTKTEVHEFALPAEIQRLDQYFGVWAGETALLRGAVASAARMDLAQHAQAYKAGGEIGGYRMDGDTAIIDMIGTMTKYGTSLSMMTYGTVGIRRAIRRAVADAKAQRIGLVIHSPGGAVEGTGDLAEEVRVAATEKPVIAYVEDMAASAAYWVASQATQIFASPSARIGSIGVYMVVYDESEAAAAEGIKTHVIRTAEFKGAGAPGAEITEAQLLEWQRQVDEVHELFAEAVKRGRNLSAEQFARVATGAVWRADKAKKLGLIDDVRSYAKAFGKSPKPVIAITQTGGRKAAATNRRTITMSENNDAMSVAEYVKTLRDACPGADDSWLLAQAVANVEIDAAKAAHYKRLAEKAATLAADLATAKAEVEDLTAIVAARNAENEALAAKVAELTEALEQAKSGPPAITGESQKPTPDGSTKARIKVLCAERMDETGESHQEAWAYVMSHYPELRDALIQEANKE